MSGSDVAPGVAPVIVTALFGQQDFAWLDGLRRAHFPPERNQVPAHITLFHHLPPAILPELRQRLNAETRGQPAPRAWIAGVVTLGRGTAFRIESPDLAALRDRLADAFTGMLVPQDQAGWRPHVTIQNKVEPHLAKALRAEMEAGFRVRPLAIAGIGCWAYRGGPWEPLSRHMFA
ncbi:2'-5' RNA ligase family protein [Sphingomonas sp. FW199]|uniref:2'-5' RNA ligase family protein n=1 Tax=Sphingomonas sp. FW199 TaxID=3400217 RepID=UPI003CF5C661